MSRIGLKPLIIPENVQVKLGNDEISITGLKGSVNVLVPSEIMVKMEGNRIDLSRKHDSKKIRSLHGLTRSLVANALIGVTEGYFKKLEINGVGFKVNLSGSALVLNLGFSHEVKYQLPEDINANVEQNVITISGIDKQRVGQIAAEIRNLKKPEPYKGKGIKYADEYIIRKAGKTASGDKE